MIMFSAVCRQYLSFSALANSAETPLIVPDTQGGTCKLRPPFSVPL